MEVALAFFSSAVKLSAGLDSGASPSSSEEWTTSCQLPSESESLWSEASPSEKTKTQTILNSCKFLQALLHVAA